MSLPLSRDFALYDARSKPARLGSHPWPRMACFAAALLASLGMWIVLVKATARLFGF